MHPTMEMYPMHGNSNEFDLSNDDIANVSHCNSDELDLPNDNIANVSHGNSYEFVIFNGDTDYMYPMTMVIIAVVCQI